MSHSTEQWSSEDDLLQPTQLTLKIWHPDCWTLEATGAVDAGLIAHSVHEYDDLVNARVTAYADEQTQIEQFVSTIRESPHTERVERIHNYFNPNLRSEGVGNSTEELLVRYPPENSIHDALLSRGFIPDEEIRISDGYEYWTVIATAQRPAIEIAINEIQQEMNAEISILGVKSPDTEVTNKQAVNRLSERQREIFEHARNEGYYSWPREISATGLAESLDISKTTLLEHLRKAEAKLLDPEF